jgi:hypothetical protein
VAHTFWMRSNRGRRKYDAKSEHVFAAGVAVADFATAVPWYEKLFGREPDVVVREGEEAMWRVVNSAWVYVVHDARRAGEGLHTILVGDLVSYSAGLAERGIDVPEIETVPGKYRKIALEDPEGNTITVGEVLREGDE